MARGKAPEKVKRANAVRQLEYGKVVEVERRLRRKILEDHDTDEKTSKKEKPLLLQSTKNYEEDIEIVQETAVKNSSKKEKPLLLPSSKDNDFSAIRRKKPR